MLRREVAQLEAEVAALEAELVTWNQKELVSAVLFLSFSAVNPAIAC